MTRKHYIGMVDIFARIANREDRHRAVEDFCRFAVKDNGNFKKDTFKAAVSKARGEPG